MATHRDIFAQIGVGGSRIGGLPDVPSGFEWPRWSPSKLRDEKSDRPWPPHEPAPLGFIAQFDLSAIPRVDDSLPGSGWLYFFYDRYREPWGFDPADRGCCRIVYIDVDRSALSRVEPPSDAEANHVAEPCIVEAWPELTLPEYLPDLQYGTPEDHSYRGLRQGCIVGGPLHRLLGHPQLVQNPMELECQLASNGVYCGSPEGFQRERAKSLESGAADWRLLLQIDTDDNGPGWMWGDGGRIYFWIKQHDLKSLRFDDAWLILQCY